MAVAPHCKALLAGRSADLGSDRCVLSLTGSLPVAAAAAIIRYEALDRRLDSLETTLLTLLRNVKSRVRNPAAGAGVGPAGEGADCKSVQLSCDSSTVTSLCSSTGTSNWHQSSCCGSRQQLDASGRPSPGWLHLGAG
jgi:hypothetical protein